MDNNTTAAGGSPLQRRRCVPKGRAPVSLVLAMGWAVLGVLFVWAGAGMLPGAAAQRGNDEGAPFPISTTSKGIGRRWVLNGLILAETVPCLSPARKNVPPEI